MRPIEILKAIVYPLTESAVLVPMIVFWLLVSFGLWGGVLGLFFLFLVLPAVFRFLMIVLEARAQGRVPPAPGVEFFHIYGNSWTLFPVLIASVMLLAVVTAGKQFGPAGSITALVLCGVFFPASIALLAITHAPLQSLNPVAHWRLQKACGRSLWIASLFLFAAAWLSVQADRLPGLLANLVIIWLTFAFFALVGSLIEPYRLVDEIDIPAPREKSDDETAEALEKRRTAILNHAYGFMSRDNRDGGFRHIQAWLEQEPDPAAAWRWFFEKMLGWENQQHALAFGQLYIHDMLLHGEEIPALKVLMRCRLVADDFRPLAEDRDRLAATAVATGNSELAAVLNRS